MNAPRPRAVPPIQSKTPTGFFLALSLGIAVLAGSYVTGLWTGPSAADLFRPAVPTQGRMLQGHEGEPRRPLVLGAGVGPGAASIPAPSGRWARPMETPGTRP
jgi:hypothetical protein